ncbi:MAG: DUF6989 domain-containing protein [Promethearchaeota archaeon]
MKIKISRELLDFIFIHLSFVVICISIILIPVPDYMGINLFILVVIYNVIFPIFGYLRKYSEWIAIWLFIFLISLFQIWPDWFLSAELGILVFPEDDFIKIGTVSLYMAGLWTIPLFLIIFIGLRIRERYSRSITYIIVGLLSLLIFRLSEQLMWMLDSWYAQNIAMIGHLAVYIIFPEILLGLSTYYGYVLLQKKKSAQNSSCFYYNALISWECFILLFFN